MNNQDSDKVLALLAKNIKKYREKLGLTQEQLAFKCGFDRTYISLLERQKRNISIKNLKKLANGLGVKIAELVRGM